MSLDGNAHVVQALVQLVLYARMTDDVAALDHKIQETAKLVERAAVAKDALLAPEQVVERYPALFPTLHVLSNHRQRGTGPKYHKMGAHRNSRVFYRISDVEAWIITHERLDRLMDLRVSERKEA